MQYAEYIFLYNNVRSILVHKSAFEHNNSLLKKGYYSEKYRIFKIQFFGRKMLKSEIDFTDSVPMDEYSNRITEIPVMQLKVRDQINPVTGM